MTNQPPTLPKGRNDKWWDIYCVKETDVEVWRPTPNENEESFILNRDHVFFTDWKKAEEKKEIKMKEKMKERMRYDYEKEKMKEKWKKKEKMKIRTTPEILSLLRHPLGVDNRKELIGKGKKKEEDEDVQCTDLDSD